MKWFKHQADANLNAKLQEVILDHGMEGYGLYWFCIELVAMNVTSSKLTFELEHDARIISRMTGLQVAKVELIMRDFIKLDLFSASEGRIQCLKLAKRCDDFTAKAIRQNGLQAIESKGVRQSPTKSDKVPLEDRSKKVEVRSKKVDAGKEKSSRFTPPSLEDVIQYCRERGNSVDADSFIDHYSANGWMRGKTKIKDWKACVRTWEKNAKPAAQKQERKRPRGFGE